MTASPRAIWTLLLTVGLAVGSFGCNGPQVTGPVSGALPREGCETPIAEYIVNPPDILYIEVAMPPSEDQVIKAGDSLAITVEGALPEHPIADLYPVRSNGTVDLGTYGVVTLGGLTVADARDHITKFLKEELNDPVVSLFVANNPPVAGEYLIRPDGTILLGFYGPIRVAGLPLSAVESAIQSQLATYHGLTGARVSVDVAAYNSMVYYIVSDGGGYGDQVTKLPYTGSETVLDAVGEMGGLPQIGSKHSIWIARPIPGNCDTAQILPVDWDAIVKHGATSTNYQIQPNDRLYVKADKLIKTDNWIAKIFAPVERVLGTITLFDITIDAVQAGPNGVFGNNNNN